MVGVWRTHNGGVDLYPATGWHDVCQREEQWIFRRRGAGRTTSNRSTEGFAFVLAGLKALLEHNVTLNLVLDRFPDGIGKH
jgi:hypothetical protein